MSNDLKFECGWWLPEDDIHLTKTMMQGNMIYKDRSTYQYSKFAVCLNFIPPSKRRIALDIGSNIGTWSYNLVDYFNYVHCFEPIEIHQNCWVRNLDGYTNIDLYPVALGDENEKVKMFSPNICTAWSYIAGPKNHDISKPTEAHKDVTVVEDVTVECLDNYNFENIDFIKIDVEGYELNVLKGAEETILKNKPYIFLEQKADNLYAVEFLENMGMYKVWSVSGDYFMAWDKIINKEDISDTIKRTFHSNQLIKFESL